MRLQSMKSRPMFCFRHAMAGAAGSVQPASSRSSSGSSGATLSGRCLLVCAVTSDSRLWQWELQLPAYPRRSFLTDVAHQPITAINTSIQVTGVSGCLHCAICSCCSWGRCNGCVQCCVPWHLPLLFAVALFQPCTTPLESACQQSLVIIVLWLCQRRLEEAATRQSALLRGLLHATDSHRRSTSGVHTPTVLNMHQN